MAKKESKTKTKIKTKVEVKKKRKRKKKAKPVGKPLIVKTPAMMDRLIEKYVKDCMEKEIPLTITGITLCLGLCSRNSLYDYEKKEEYQYSIKRAKLLIENGYEINLHGTSPTGSIFALKNFGWTDKPEEDASTSAEDLVNALSKLLEAAPN